VFTRLSARVYKNEKPASKPAAWVDRNYRCPIILQQPVARSGVDSTYKASSVLGRNDM
jgi:hypothetical protein